MTVPQDQLVQLANDMCQLMQRARVELQTATDLLNQYTNLDAGAGFAALPTCPTNPDGSLGLTDTTPVVDHVIDNRVIGRLSVAITSYDLGVVHDIIAEYVHLLQGVAVATQQYAPAMMARTSP